MTRDPLERIPISAQDEVNIVVQGFASKARHRASATRRSCRGFIIAFTLVAALIASAYGYYRYKFPYGWTHCCDMQLHLALHNYAVLHNRRFPSGQSTPEASLSLLHREPDPVSAGLLCGKNVAPEIAERVFAEGQLLGPDTCGWHYVPGLSLTDDPKLALFWDKSGLGHNGQRLGGGGHIVWFINGDNRHIPASEWESFLAEQNSLRQAAVDSERCINSNGTIVTAKSSWTVRDREKRVPAIDRLTRRSPASAATLQRSRASHQKPFRQMDCSEAPRGYLARSRIFPFFDGSGNLVSLLTITLGRFSNRANRRRKNAREV